MITPIQGPIERLRACAETEDGNGAWVYVRSDDLRYALAMIKVNAGELITHEEIKALATSILGEQLASSVVRAPGGILE